MNSCNRHVNWFRPVRKIAPNIVAVTLSRGIQNGHIIHLENYAEVPIVYFEEHVTEKRVSVLIFLLAMSVSIAKQFWEMILRYEKVKNIGVTYYTYKTADP